MKKRIAVYGTLKSGKPLHYILSESDKKENDKISGTLYTNGSLPFLVDGKNSVEVETYNVTETTFSYLKRMEEAAGYKTKLTKMRSGREAYVFFYPEVGNNFRKINRF